MCSKSAPRMTPLGGNGASPGTPGDPVFARLASEANLGCILDPSGMDFGISSLHFQTCQTYLASKDPSDLCTRHTLERIK